MTDDATCAQRPWRQCNLCGGNCPRWGMETAHLHNKVIAYVDAVHGGDPHVTYKLFVELTQIARLAPSGKEQER